jgi:hypothetical protein
MKNCTTCNQQKPLECFYKGKQNKDGFRPSCKDCIKKYQEANRDAKIEYLKRYKELNKNILSIKNKEYRERNKEKIKNWKEENKSYFKKYRQENKDKVRNYMNKRNREEPIFRFKNNVRRLILHSFKRGKKNFKKTDKTEQILGCTIDFFMNYISLQFEKRMDFNNHGKWHIDHIIPLSTAKTKDDVIRLNHYTNLRPLWAKENISKGNKIIEKQLVLI